MTKSDTSRHRPDQPPQPKGNRVTQYLAGRILALPVVLLGASLLVFGLIRLIPGDAAAVLAGPLASESELQRMREALGLDRPLPVQYVLWIGRVARGDLGQSYERNAPVLPLVLRSFANTAILTSASLSMAVIVGVTAGVISATRRGSIVDRLIMLFALMGNSMPAYWLGLVFILVFAVGLRWLPSSGMYPTRGTGTWLNMLPHLVLPSLTLAAVSTAVIVRITRASVLEVIALDHVRTARSKGLHESLVVRRHVVWNALLPIVTVVGIQAGYLLGGAVLVETVFAWPGVGLQLFQAIASRDLPVILGGVLIVAIVFSLTNLAVDTLYAVLDPRIRYT